jgi:hypothetical protein
VSEHEIPVTHETPGTSLTMDRIHGRGVGQPGRPGALPDRRHRHVLMFRLHVLRVVLMARIGGRRQLLLCSFGRLRGYGSRSQTEDIDRHYFRAAGQRQPSGGRSGAVRSGAISSVPGALTPTGIGTRSESRPAATL